MSCAIPKWDGITLPAISYIESNLYNIFDSFQTIPEVNILAGIFFELHLVTPPFCYRRLCSRGRWIAEGECHMCHARPTDLRFAISKQ